MAVTFRIPIARRIPLLVVAALLLVPISCAASPAGSSIPSGSAESAGPPPEALITRIVAEYPHDPTAFTQGLEFRGDVLYESTGRVGSTYVRSSTWPADTEIARADVTQPWFGEGITIADTDQGPVLWQLTWRDHTAIARDPATLDQLRTVTYDGEGWGICALGDRLVRSDGSDTLTFHDPVDFHVLGTVRVTDAGGSVDRLNELECTPDGVYANIWTTDRLVRIDPTTGRVTATIDASPLRWAVEQRPDAAGIDVLNGVAAIPGTDRFLLTGKLWPVAYEVELAAQSTS